MCIRDSTCTVEFNGHVEETEEKGRKVFKLVDTYQIDAVPYDMPVVGYNNNCVNTVSYTHLDVYKRQHSRRTADADSMR